MNRIRKNIVYGGLVTLLSVGSIVGLEGCSRKYEGKTEKEWAQLADESYAKNQYGSAYTQIKNAEAANPKNEKFTEKIETYRVAWEASKIPKEDPSIAVNREFFKGLDIDGRYALYSIQKGDNPSVVAAKLEAARKGIVYNPSRVKEKSLYASEEWLGIMGAITGPEAKTSAEGLAKYNHWEKGQDMKIPVELIKDIK